MSWETAKTLASIVGPLIAIISIAINIYLFRLNRNDKSPLASREEIRDALHKLIAQIDSTRVMTIQPHSENWQFGFDSLEKLRVLSATANILIENSPIVPQKFKDIVGGFLMRVKAVYNFRDDFSHFMRGRPYVSAEEYQKWKTRTHAENALYDLHRYFSTREGELREYIRHLNS